MAKRNPGFESNRVPSRLVNRVVREHLVATHLAALPADTPYEDLLAPEHTPEYFQISLYGFLDPLARLYLMNSWSGRITAAKLANIPNCVWYFASLHKRLINAPPTSSISVKTFSRENHPSGSCRLFGISYLSVEWSPFQVPSLAMRLGHVQARSEAPPPARPPSGRVCRPNVSPRRPDVAQAHIGRRSMGPTMLRRCTAVPRYAFGLMG